jgi:hypothetical protein
MKQLLLIEEDEPKIIRRRLKRIETDANDFLPKTLDEMKVQMRIHL